MKNFYAMLNFYEIILPFFLDLVYINVACKESIVKMLLKKIMLFFISTQPSINSKMKSQLPLFLNATSNVLLSYLTLEIIYAMHNIE